MIIAQEKKKNNIAEYILYMWQIEDIVRANGFDIENINRNIVEKFEQPEEIKSRITSWYEDIISMMQMERIAQKGHLQIVMNQIIELNNLHLQLLHSPAEIDYQVLYKNAQPAIGDFRIKMKSDTTNEIEICFTALYAILLLKLQKNKITKDTNDAIESFSKMISLLAKKYHAS